MDQEAWDQIYIALEGDIAALRGRGARVDEAGVILEVDRARFAMDRGDVDEAIARVQILRQQLRSAEGTAPTRSGGQSPTVDRLDALEDSLHAATRLGSARLEIVGEDEEPPTRAASQNTKVNKSIKYDDIKDEYLKLWNGCRIRENKTSAVRREADRLVSNRAVYEEIAGETDVPWWFVGLIHAMECSFSLQKHLHNGDSLKARTWQVPAGRPKDGSAPFTFVDSAVDALEYDGFAGKTDWPLPMVLYRLERYNGFGYRKKFGFASPYLWSYTNHFSSGKYVRDGVFDPNAESKQCGAGAMLRDLIERGIVSFDANQQPVVATVPKPVQPAPSPAVGPSGATATATGSAAPTAPIAAPAAIPTPASVTTSPPATTVVAAPAQPSTSQPAVSEPSPAQPAPAQPAPAQPAPAVSPGAAPVAPVSVAAAPVASAPAAQVPEPVASPAPSPPVAAAPPVPAAVLPASAPASVAVPAPAPVPPPPATTAAPAAEASAGVSNAVAAALAELAKRSK